MFKKAWTTKFPAAMEHFRRNVSFHSMSGLDYVWGVTMSVRHHFEDE